MNESDWAAVKKVLGDALECPAVDRAAVLDSACGSDHALRAEVERLLAAEAMAGNLLPSEGFEIVERHNSLQGT